MSWRPAATNLQLRAAACTVYIRAPQGAGTVAATWRQRQSNLHASHLAIILSCPCFPSLISSSPSRQLWDLIPRTFYIHTYSRLSTSFLHLSKLGQSDILASSILSEDKGKAHFPRRPRHSRRHARAIAYIFEHRKIKRLDYIIEIAKGVISKERQKSGHSQRRCLAAADPLEPAP